MTLAQTLQLLEAAGLAQTRKTCARFGVGPNMFGVSYDVLGKLTRQIKRDHALAVGLRASGNHDARVLATMIADPQQADAALLDSWATACDNPGVTGAVGKFASSSSVAETMAANWCEEDREFVAVAGWDIVAELAADSNLPEGKFTALLKTIERDIHGVQNCARYAMNAALISIGLRNVKLEKLIITTAKRIGKVEVDHGDTACQTPDAIAYIAKVKARRAKRK